MKKLFLVLALLGSFAATMSQEKKVNVVLNGAPPPAGRIEYLDPVCVRITGVAPTQSMPGTLPAEPGQSGKPQVMIDGKPAAPGEYIIANGGMTAIRKAPAGQATTVPPAEQAKPAREAPVSIPSGIIADTTRLRSGIVTYHK